MQKKATRFQDLRVWQKAHELVVELYRISATFPQSELFGLTSQLRRAAVSVPANIAEGFRRYGRADKARFMNIAHCSLEEVRYYLILIAELGYSDTSALPATIEEISKMIAAYHSAILAAGSRGWTKGKG